MVAAWSLLEQNFFYGTLWNLSFFFHLKICPLRLKIDDSRLKFT